MVSLPANPVTGKNLVDKKECRRKRGGDMWFGDLNKVGMIVGRMERVEGEGSVIWWDGRPRFGLFCIAGLSSLVRVKLGEIVCVMNYQ